MEGVEETNSPPAFKVSEEEEGRVAKEAGRYQLSQGDEEEEVAKCRTGEAIVEHNRIWHQILKSKGNYAFAVLSVPETIFRNHSFIINQ